MLLLYTNPKPKAFISNNQFIFIYIIATPRIFIFNHSFDIYTFVLRAGNQYWFSSPTLDCCTPHYQTKTYIKISNKDLHKDIYLSWTIPRCISGAIYKKILSPKCNTDHLLFNQQNLSVITQWLMNTKNIIKTHLIL